MIQSFADQRPEDLFRGGRCANEWRAFRAVTERKLDMVAAATSVNDLRSPPGNRLEKLKGDRPGQWSIRINDQYRICFRWGALGPEQVEIVDYH
jgi:toxin HigB-1